MRKTDIVPNLNYISSTFPIVYRGCDFCGIKFKLEKGWKYSTYSPAGMKHTRWVCSDCCSCKEEVHNKRKEKYSLQYVPVAAVS